jgi:hypothetical protein
LNGSELVALSLTQRLKVRISKSKITGSKQILVSSQEYYYYGMVYEDNTSILNPMKKIASIAFLITFLGVNSAQANVPRFNHFHRIDRTSHTLQLSLLQSSTEKRNTPGIATGGENLSVVTGKWLKGSEGNVGIVPKQIADKLRGKKFSNFDKLRNEFWIAVSQESVLADQFSKSNITRMSSGLAPIALENQWLGENKSYVLHHKTPIQQGGGVYDLNNLVVVTPRYHKEILDPAYHY